MNCSNFKKTIWFFAFGFILGIITIFGVILLCAHSLWGIATLIMSLSGLIVAGWLLTTLFIAPTFEDFITYKSHTANENNDAKREKPRA